VEDHVIDPRDGLKLVTSGLLRSLATAVSGRSAGRVLARYDLTLPDEPDLWRMHARIGRGEALRLMSVPLREDAICDGRPVRAADLREYCLSFAGAEETFPFGPVTAVFKVEGKMFALSALDRAPLCVSLKCEPLLAEELRASHPAVTPGWHLNKRHWNTVVLDGSLPDEMVRDMVEDSYDLVVGALPKAKRRALGWEPEVGHSP
jgi:predicted DNA-binding protein (MmcQ/YjbR family)